MTTPNDTTRPEHAQPSPLNAADAAQEEFSPTPAGPVQGSYRSGLRSVVVSRVAACSTVAIAV